jgi:hypothetical protein
MNKQTCTCKCKICDYADNTGWEHCEHCVPSQEEEQDWENKIRSDYKGLLLDQQIEATVAYWKNVFELHDKEVREQERERIRQAFNRAIGSGLTFTTGEFKRIVDLVLR